MYNLNEEEELTHYGQSLAEIEKFNDIANSDDESEEKGLLSGEFERRMSGNLTVSVLPRACFILAPWIAVLDLDVCVCYIYMWNYFLSHTAELTASHFGGGGGLLRKKASGEEQEGNQRAKSRQELIEELIQKSKQEKVS